MVNDTTINDLLALLAEYGGAIVSSNDEKPEWIEQARAGGRMYVDDNNLGYIWNPPLYDLPSTEHEAELFDKWFPLPIELPADLKDPEIFFKKLEARELNKKQQKLN